MRRLIGLAAAAAMVASAGGCADIKALFAQAPTSPQCARIGADLDRAETALTTIEAALAAATAAHADPAAVAEIKLALTAAQGAVDEIRGLEARKCPPPAGVAPPGPG